MSRNNRNDSPQNKFPPGFIWGTASSGYQIEGAGEEDGKGPSVWDEFCRTPGAIKSNDTGETACDHYHLYNEDVRLIKAIGAQAYRFSISWPRILPMGLGKPNAPGIDFYSKLVDRLLENGIEPWVTLFHWDYPLALFLKGGWLCRESADWFAEYTGVVVHALSDRVSHWITLNEPKCFIGLGHQTGNHAPGLKLPLKDVLLAGHHALLAHGKSVATIRASAKIPPTIGIAPDCVVRFPETESDADVAAARKAMFMISEKNVFNNNWFSDAMVLGQYPGDAIALFGGDMPVIRPGDMETIGQPLDFFGINIYFGTRIRAGADGQPEPIPRPIGCPATTMDWEVTPEALFWGPKFFYERYTLPLVITENGMSGCDWVGLDGKVHDPQRIDFADRYLRELSRSIKDGVDCRGYFYWSVLDNFEWSEGFSKRFGLVHVDYATRKRTIKDSGRWFKRLAESNGNTIFQE